MLEIKDIYEIYKKDVYYYLISLTHDASISEDLLSETFISAIKSLPTFRGDADIKTWLFSIARYKWYGYLRKKRDDIPFEELAKYYLADNINLELEVIEKETINKILSLLEREQTKTKEIVIMRIQGYSFYEIAEKYSISESSARVIDFRAKKKIKKVFEKEGFKNE